MLIDISGDALCLLEHFICYATGKHSETLAAAMFYDVEGFRARAFWLEKAFRKAMDEAPCP